MNKFGTSSSAGSRDEKDGKGLKSLRGFIRFLEPLKKPRRYLTTTSLR
jgi:hypothetical protein